MLENEMNRRAFMRAAAVGGAGLVGLGGLDGGGMLRAQELGGGLLGGAEAGPVGLPYGGPNVVVVRFGGGVRRTETINDRNTYCPYVLHDLAKRGTLFTNMSISESVEVESGEMKTVPSSHGQGTLNILTGAYSDYPPVSQKYPEQYSRRIFDDRFEADVPTIFEYLRKRYRIESHEALTINNEDRTDEEFYSFSNHHLFGANYRCHTLSLYRYKVYKLRDQIAQGMFEGQELAQKQQELAKLEEVDFRNIDTGGQGEVIDGFWERWRRYYGDSGFKNPRGDRLLTELTVRAMRELRPRLLMVNYTDPDYVHWGNMSHYTRGISIIDEGIKRLVEVADADEFYRGNTVFVLVPDCGRDNNRFQHVPCQHHFNTKAAREIFALVVGPGVDRGAVVDRAVEQIDIAPTIGRLMGFETEHVMGDALEEVWA